MYSGGAFGTLVLDCNIPNLGPRGDRVFLGARACQDMLLCLGGPNLLYSVESLCVKATLGGVFIVLSLLSLPIGIGMGKSAELTMTTAPVFSGILITRRFGFFLGCIGWGSFVLLRVGGC